MKKYNKLIIKILTISIIILPLSVNAACSDYCNDLAPAVRLVKYGVVPLFQIGIPILLIVVGMIDLAKAVVASKEDEMKKSSSMFKKRCIYAVAVFFVITIVTVMMNLFEDTNTGVKGTQEWYYCWNVVDECEE